LLTLLFLLICPGCPAAGDNRFQEKIVFFNYMRNEIDILLYNDKVYLLSGVVFLIGMIGKLPHIA
jgi:hypothetical protein